MIFISIEFAGITINRSEINSTYGLSRKESRMSPIYYILKSLTAAASDLGGYYAHESYRCSSPLICRVIYGLKHGQQQSTSIIDYYESKTAGKRLERSY
jgi:hypothetical protein